MTEEQRERSVALRVLGIQLQMVTTMRWLSARLSAVEAAVQSSSAPTGPSSPPPLLPHPATATPAPRRWSTESFTQALELAQSLARILAIAVPYLLLAAGMIKSWIGGLTPLLRGMLGL